MHPTIQSSFWSVERMLSKSKFLDTRKVKAIRRVVVTCIVLTFILMNESFDKDMDE